MVVDERDDMQQSKLQDLIEMTIPDKPNSRLQKYRLTAKGHEFLVAQKREPGKRS